jgi:hypothetical protein
LSRTRRAPAWRHALLALASLAAGACGGHTEHMGAHAPFAGCTESPIAPPAALALAPFYAK